MSTDHAPFERFGELLWGVISSRGLNTLGKRDLLLEIMNAASQSGLLDLTQHRLDLARKLMASPSVVDGWLRDLYLQKDRSGNWTFEKFLTWIENAECGTEDDFQKGLLVFQVTGAEQRIQSPKFDS